MKRLHRSIAKAVLISGCVLTALSLAGCGGEGNFETTEPYTEAEGEELEALEESPSEQSN